MREEFNPPLFLRNPRIQTYLASSRARAKGKNSMLDASKEVIIDTGTGVRLLAGYSQNKNMPFERDCTAFSRVGREYRVSLYFERRKISF